MKCTTIEGKITIWGNDIDDNLPNVELLSREDGMYETSSQLTNLSMMGQGIERVRKVAKI